MSDRPFRVNRRPPPAVGITVYCVDAYRSVNRCAKGPVCKGHKVHAVFNSGGGEPGYAHVSLYRADGRLRANTIYACRFEYDDSLPPGVLAERHTVRA